ncbi:MAG: PBECR4 domain-containing protein [Clostridium sp.]|nr:PBECR4 domain-containing protein [Clostridium sp.]
MTEQNFKKRVCLEIIQAAKRYKEVYLDYEYLIYSEAFEYNKYYIVNAKKDNFQHLTGVHSYINPQTFFDKCYQGTLTEKDFDFVKKEQDEKSVKGTVRRKIKVLPDMMKLFEIELLAEENFQKNKVFCSFAAANGSCTLGFFVSKKARPKSLIKGNALKNPKMVELVLRKKSGTEFFDEIIIGDKKILHKYQNIIGHIISPSLTTAPHTIPASFRCITTIS